MRKLVVVTIMFMFFLCISAYAQQEEHLAGLYFFDENGGEVIDASGNGNNGVFRGGVERVDGNDKINHQ